VGKNLCSKGYQEKVEKYLVAKERKPRSKKKKKGGKERGKERESRPTSRGDIQTQTYADVRKEGKGVDTSKNLNKERKLQSRRTKGMTAGGNKSKQEMASITEKEGGECLYGDARPEIGL